MTALFQTGQITATPGAMEAMNEEFGDRIADEVLNLLRQHVTGQWPHDCEEDQQSNRDAIKYGNRVFTSWITEGGKKLWIITEADRSLTTILLPEEY